MVRTAGYHLYSYTVFCSLLVLVFEFFVPLPVLILTYKVPLPIGYVGGNIHIYHLEVYQPAIVSPGAKLQVTLLHIEWKPPYIDVTGTFQDAWRKVLGMLL